jgi:hypothetical protein
LSINTCSGVVIQRCSNEESWHQNGTFGMAESLGRWGESENERGKMKIERDFGRIWRETWWKEEKRWGSGDIWVDERVAKSSLANMKSAMKWKFDGSRKISGDWGAVFVRKLEQIKILCHEIKSIDIPSWT